MRRDLAGNALPDLPLQLLAKSFDIRAWPVAVVIDTANIKTGLPVFLAEYLPGLLVIEGLFEDTGIARLRRHRSGKEARQSVSPQAGAVEIPVKEALDQPSGVPHSPGHRRHIGVLNETADHLCHVRLLF